MGGRLHQNISYSIASRNAHMELTCTRILYSFAMMIGHSRILLTKDPEMIKVGNESNRRR